MAKRTQMLQNDANGSVQQNRSLAAFLFRFPFRFQLPRTKIHYASIANLIADAEADTECASHLAGRRH